METMRGLESMRGEAGAEALLGWWSLAGVDEALLAEPRGWLNAGPADVSAPSGPTGTLSRPALARASSLAPTFYPDTLDAFHAWLAQSDDLPEAGWPGDRILPTGALAPALMVIVDMPEAHDSDVLMSGEEGKLFDAILAALGTRRTAVYLASLAMARPMGGMLDSAETAQLAGRMRHHINLVQPAKLLILSDRAAKALGVIEGQGNAQGLRFINHVGGTVAGIATHHPRFLLRHPTEKGAAWAAMRRLIEDAVQ